jgi:Branched-chain amino acid transport system / permease component
MTTFLVTIGIGLSTAAILALSAVAFTLEYAVSRIANFAHGEFLTLGAYAAYSGQTIFHQNVAAAAVIKAISYPTAHAVLTSVYGTSVTGAANTAFVNLFNQLFPSQKTAGPLANANYAYDAVISLALADDYAETTNGTTVAHDMTMVTNPPGTACYTYSTCLTLIKAGTKINYEGASGDLGYNKYSNTFGPYGAFQANAAGIEQQVYVMSASALAAATP